MNIGVTTSFVIGGLMLLSILAFNRSLNSSTQETTLSTITHQKMDNLVDILSYDIERLGYNENDDIFIYNPIQISSDEELKFQVSSSDNIHWHLETDEAVSSSSNPNDFYLYREDENGSTTKFPVTNFEIKYFIKDHSGNWNESVNPSSVGELTNLKVQIEILMESEEPISTNSSGNESYYRSAWKRFFVPTNVNLKQWK